MEWCNERGKLYIDTKTLALSVISHYYHLVFIASVTSVFVGGAVPNISLYSLQL